jgi:hypothetical protein
VLCLNRKENSPRQCVGSWVFWQGFKKKKKNLERAWNCGVYDCGLHSVLLEMIIKKKKKKRETGQDDLIDKFLNRDAYIVYSNMADMITELPHLYLTPQQLSETFSNLCEIIPVWVQQASSRQLTNHFHS